MDGYQEMQWDYGIGMESGDAEGWAKGEDEGQRACKKKLAVKEGAKTIACYDGSGMDNGK